MLDVVSLLGIERRVVEQDLDAVGASFFQSLYGPMVEQIAEAARTGLVVPSLFIGEQQAGTFRATPRSRQSPLGVEKNSAGMFGQNFRDADLNVSSSLSPACAPSAFCSEPR